MKRQELYHLVEYETLLGLELNHLAEIEILLRGMRIRFLSSCEIWSPTEILSCSGVEIFGGLYHLVMNYQKTRFILICWVWNPMLGLDIYMYHEVEFVR